MELLQIDQPQLSKVLIETPSFRHSKGPLTAPTQMLNKPATHVPIDRTLCPSRISKGKIIGPSPELPVDLLYQSWHRYMTLPTIDHPSKRFPLGLQCLGRRGYIQVPKSATSKVPIVSERETQKVQTGSRLPKVDNLGLCSIQFQTKPGFDLRLDIVTQSTALIPGKHHKIVRIADDVRLGPATRTAGRIKHLLKPMEVYICQKRRNDSPNAKDNLADSLLYMVRMVLWRR
jgi:hypothetical protein